MNPFITIITILIFSLRACSARIGAKMLSLFEMSIIGAVLITVIIILRALAINRMPKKAFLILWAAALVRLILPFRLSSPVSIYRAAGEELLRQSHDWTGPGGALRPLLLTAENIPDAARTVSPLSLLWLAGLLALAMAFLITHLRSRRTYLASLPVENSFVKGWIDSHRLRRPVQVRYSDQIGAPLTYGILWPVVLFPKSVNWEDEKTLGYILAHEFSHIRRFDALTKWIFAAVLCIHWFNPLVWAMYVLANRDLELSCDEAVVRLYGPGSRSSYALALVGMEERRACPAPLSSCFSRQALKERIVAVMNSRPLTFGSILAACVLVAVTVALFATSAPAGRPDRLRIMEDDSTVPSDSKSSAPAENSLTKQVSPETEPLSEPDTKEAPFSQDETSVSSSVYGQDEADEPGYTKEQYDRVVKALTVDGYENMPIAEFNRTVNAALNDERDYPDSLAYLYEKVLSFIPADDPNAAYLINTVQLSLREYNARMNEAYSGEREDPEYFGSAQVIHNDEVFGDPVTIIYGEAGYSFTYRILEQDRLTVGERDAFIQKIIRAAQETLESSAKKETTEREYGDALKAAGKAASNDKIEFTGCEVSYLNINID